MSCHKCTDCKCATPKVKVIRSPEAMAEDLYWERQSHVGRNRMQRVFLAITHYWNRLKDK